MRARSTRCYTHCFTNNARVSSVAWYDQITCVKSQKEREGTIKFIVINSRGFIACKAYLSGDVWDRPEAVPHPLDLPLAHQALEVLHEAAALPLPRLRDAPRSFFRHAPHGLTVTAVDFVAEVLCVGLVVSIQPLQKICQILNAFKVANQDGRFGICFGQKMSLKNNGKQRAK